MSGISYINRAFKLMKEAVENSTDCVLPPKLCEQVLLRNEELEKAYSNIAKTLGQRNSYITELQIENERLNTILAAPRPE